MLKFKEYPNLEYKVYKPYKKISKPLNLIGLIMVKNQEDNVLNALKSISKICDSIIVVDTGSTDDTVNRIKKKYPSVILKHLKWEEDYSKMRNLCLDIIPNDHWVLFLDSDEIITSKCDYYEIHGFLNQLEKKYPEKDIICTVNQIQEKRPVFFQPERFIKKSDSLKCYGYVHEEPRSNCPDNLIRINTNIEVINLGSNKQEIKKFDKEKRYAELLLKNIVKEPNNPRWASLMTSRLVENGYLSYNDYIKQLKKHILVDEILPLNIINIKINPYTSYLLERYAIELIKSGQNDLALEYIKIGKNIFPYDATFIVLETSIFLKQIEEDCYRKLENIISYTKEYDNELIHESSEGSEEALTGVVVRLLYILGKYEQAKDIYLEISDENIKQLLTNELSLFT